MSNTITIGGYACFSGYTCELNPDGSFAPAGIAERPGDIDPDGAAAALRWAGYQVTRMPQSFRSRLEHRRSQLDTLRYLSGRDQAPQRYQQLARQRHDH